MNRNDLVPYTVVARGRFTHEYQVWLPPGASHEDIVNEAWDVSLNFGPELDTIDLDPNEIEVIGP